MAKNIGYLLVSLMVLLQGFYGVFAYLDPVSFANVRGTALVANGDIDWVQIYASRTVFISLIIGTLLYFRESKVLMWAALLGTVMPLSDGYLAYQAEAPLSVIAKHIATIVYLIITSLVLFKVVASEKA